MPYLDNVAATHPRQDLDELLLWFTAETLARVDFERNGHSGLTFEEWNAKDTDRTRVEAAAEKASILAASGMLRWPSDTTELEVSWFLQLPGENPDHRRPETLGTTTEFNRDCAAAIETLRACHSLDRPARLYWSWDIRHQIRKPTRGKVGQ